MDIAVRATSASRSVVRLSVCCILYRTTQIRSLAIICGDAQDQTGRVQKGLVLSETEIHFGTNTIICTRSIDLGLYFGLASDQT
jgi:hypothetical protein